MLPELKQRDLELIQCSRQPGRLRISRYACAQRYLLAQKKDTEIPNDEFGMARKSSLEICRTCPEGRIYSEILAKKSPVHNKNLKTGFQGEANAFSGQRQHKRKEGLLCVTQP